MVLEGLACCWVYGVVPATRAMPQVDGSCPSPSLARCLHREDYCVTGLCARAFSLNETVGNFGCCPWKIRCNLRPMTTHNERLAGKVALITGAASGMGASHARMLAEHGARVVITDVSEEMGQDLAREIGSEHAHFVHLDVTDFDQWREAVRTTVEHFGKLDVLVNNAGIFTSGSVEEATLADWDKTLAIDLNGTFYGMKAALPALRENKTASIINISSIAGVTGFKNRAAYSAAKWAVQGLTKTSALDLGEYNIRVNCVHPGSVETPLTANLKRGLGQVPLGRAAQVEEISSLIVYLASDESTFTTGGSFVIDGGETAGNNLRDDQ